VPTIVAVLYTFLLLDSGTFSVKPIKIGMLPSGSTIMKSAMAALANSEMKSNETSPIMHYVYSGVDKNMTAKQPRFMENTQK
jgi:hypothetical protein